MSTPFQVNRRQVLGAMAALPLLAGGCSLVSGGGSNDNVLRTNYAGSADTMQIPSPNPIADKLSEVVGMDVTNERTPEDMGAALAGGQAPDIFLSSRSQLRAYDRQGLLLDLTPYRDQLADYEAFVTTDQLNTGMIDGRLMAVLRKPREFSYGGLWIRGDWLDKLGLDLPKTTEDFAEAMKAFRDEKPGRSDAVPFTGSGAGAFSMLYGAFGVGSPDDLYANGGEIVDGYNDPANLEPLEYIHSLFDEKLIDPDLFSVKTADARDRALQGSAGAIYTGWDQMKKPEYVEAAKKAQPDSDWRMIDVLSAPGHEGVMPSDAYGAVQGIPAELADNEEKLNATIKLLNYLGTEEGSRLVMFGIEGTHYEVDGDSVKALPAMDEEGAYFFAYQMAGRDEEFYLDVKFDAQREYWKACMERERLATYQTLVTPPEGFSTADANRFGSEQTVLFMTGERNLNEYPKFLDELNSQFDYSTYVDSAREQLAELGLPE